MINSKFQNLHGLSGNSASRDPERQRLDLGQPSFPDNSSKCYGACKFHADYITAGTNTMLSSKINNKFLELFVEPSLKLKFPFLPLNDPVCDLTNMKGEVFFCIFRC